MNEWLLVFKKSQVTPRTFEGNFRQFKKYIGPKISGMKLDEINSIVIQKLLNEMLEKGLSLTYVKKVKFLLRQFFEYSIDNKMLIINPVDKIKVRANERKIYDNEKIASLVEEDDLDELIKLLEEKRNKRK